MAKSSTTFKKGKSGNPKGAPKMAWTWAGVLRQLSKEKLKGVEIKELAGRALLKEVLKGNVPAIKEYGDRMDGKAPQRLTGVGEDGEEGPIEIKVTYK